VERFDIIVLGAGIVGVSTAWHLLRRGRTVAIVDRRGPGEETSFGNAGVVERDGFLPMHFPDSLGELLRFATNTQPQVHYHLGALPSLAPYLLAMRSGSHPSRFPAYAAAMAPLMARTVEEHRMIADAAGAWHLFRETGGLRLFRTPVGLAGGKVSSDFADRYGAPYKELTRDEALELEPNLKPDFVNAVWWSDVISSSSPGGVTRLYAEGVQKDGGKIFIGDARSLRRDGEAWTVTTASGPLTAPTVVVALGPWSSDVLQPMGYRYPFGVIRGYHRHYKPIGNASLARPVFDMTNGYVITPMEKGIRLTSGYEFALRDAPATPVQIDRDLPLARQLFPLGETVDDAAWLGRRPCLPDSLPIIGPAPKHPGLFLNFGHSHLGFTLGPATGRLIAEMIAGTKPFADPAPFAATRFG
jgi:D-amino-acid dehydrogenase